MTPLMPEEQHDAWERVRALDHRIARLMEDVYGLLEQVEALTSERRVLLGRLAPWSVGGPGHPSISPRRAADGAGEAAR
jgi:hypothetical protein